MWGTNGTAQAGLVDPEKPGQQDRVSAEPQPPSPAEGDDGWLGLWCADHLVEAPQPRQRVA